MNTNGKERKHHNNNTERKSQKGENGVKVAAGRQSDPSAHPASFSISSIPVAIINVVVAAEGRVDNSRCG
jgi:hypothetical protein